MRLILLLSLVSTAFTSPNPQRGYYRGNNYCDVVKSRIVKEPRAAAAYCTSFLKVVPKTITRTVFVPKTATVTAPGQTETTTMTTTVDGTAGPCRATPIDLSGAPAALMKRDYRYVAKPYGLSPYKKNSDVSSACRCLVTTSTITTRVTSTFTRATQTVTPPVTAVTVTKTTTILPVPTVPSTFLIAATDIEDAPESDRDFLDGLYILVNRAVSAFNPEEPVIEDARMTFAARASSPQFASRFILDAERRLIGQGGEIEGLVGNFWRLQEVDPNVPETLEESAVQLSSQALIDSINSDPNEFLRRQDLLDCVIVPRLDQTCSLECNRPLVMNILDARTSSGVPTWDISNSLDTLNRREYIYRPIVVEAPA